MWHTRPLVWNIRICKRGGLTLWSKPRHTLRRNCETGWSAMLPIIIVPEWLGNSPEAADFVKPLALTADAVWHSGKACAAQAAEILASAIAVSQGILQREGLAPNDPIALIAKELSSPDEDVMIVGHMPFLGKLGSGLVAGDESAEIIAFQQGGIVCLERDEDSTWRVKWMMIKGLTP